MVLLNAAICMSYIVINQGVVELELSLVQEQLDCPGYMWHLAADQI